MQVEPQAILAGPTPRLLDEWQLAPLIWNYVRRAVDDRQAPGQFILTGSSVPNDDHTRHSGAGRFSFLRMRPMSLFESGHSSGGVSLAALMAGEFPRCSDVPLTIADIANRLTVGGWPGLQSLSVADAGQAMRDYVTQASLVDVPRVAGGSRDPERVRALMAALARNVATEVSISVLARDSGGADESMGRDTVRDYLDALERLMVLEPVPAWSTHLRSKATLRQAQKRHFVDPSLAVAALDASPKRLAGDLEFLGLLFESMVIRDLRVLAEPLNGQLRHYRDSYGLEVDSVVQLNDGRWAAFEIKLGHGRIDEGAANLLRFAGTVDTSRIGEPQMLGVITSTGYGYRRPDGVAVIPIGALGP